MGCLDVFKMPVPVTIMGRTSSITNSFVNGIIPCIMPSEEQVRNNLRILGMDEKTIRCAYCGDRCTEWDHFRPLVENKRPTGYISEIDNLVPVCGKCNQSKGNKTWREWITGGAPLSPKTRGIGDLEQTMERLKRYEEETHPVKLDFESIAGKERWAEHWKNCERLHAEMQRSQELSNEIRKILRDSLAVRRGQEARREQEARRGQEARREQKAEQEQESGRKQENGTGSAVRTRDRDTSYKEDARLHMEDNSNIPYRPVGILVQTEFKGLLESGALSAAEINNLQDAAYSNRTFGINFSVLKKVESMAKLSEERKDRLGRDRYYAKPVKINNEWYLLSTQWYERNRERLIRYLEYHGGGART